MEEKEKKIITFCATSVIVNIRRFLEFQKKPMPQHPNPVNSIKISLMIYILSVDHKLIQFSFLSDIIFCLIINNEKIIHKVTRSELIVLGKSMSMNEYT